LRAGEPLVVGGPTFGISGAPFLWPAGSIPIQYTTDEGVFGVDGIPATTARVDAMFQIWEDIPTSTIAFTNAGTIDSVPAQAACVGPDGDVDTVVEFNCLSTADFPGNPIIYDQTGAIIEQLTGVGGSNFVLGIAGPRFSSTGVITSARAVLNGKFRDGLPSPADAAITEFEATMLHEFGHYLGLGHSQVNLICKPSQGGCASLSDFTFGLPTMFPVIIFGLEETAGVNPARTLSADDIAEVSRHYPDASFNTTYGTITGTVFFSDGMTHL